MYHLRTGMLLGCLTFMTCCASLQAENWPGWRGPRGDGTSLETSIPQEWDGPSGKNIAWKVPLAGIGHASPIVWENRIFVVSCVKGSQMRTLTCFERTTGKRLWHQEVIKSNLERLHALNSYASSTPATDGELVYVAFLQSDGGTTPALNVGAARPATLGRVVVAAYDFEGRRQWLQQVGEFASVHGFCSCPVLYNDMVILNGDHDGDGYVVALDRKTGETRWKVARKHHTRSYVTPLIRTVAGRQEMVLSGSRSVISLNPDDGSTIWEIDGPTEQFVASMVYDGKLFFMAAGFPTYHVMGIRPGGQGNVTQTHVAWHARNAACYVPSPVVLENRLFVADDRGTANCYDATTGKRLWKSRLGKHYSASLISGGGKVYFLSDDGITKIVAPAKKLEVLAENRLFAEGQTGEFCSASPALSGGQLFVRTNKHLFCIGKTAAER
ncbi:MAG: PQQ-binding-like beta-propeller repeat protein [Pirellulales bacterium]|nr:PQQ-binding-like beta-propeller repeat protein [Pirellulales bacterium]